MTTKPVRHETSPKSLSELHQAPLGRLSKPEVSPIVGRVLAKHAERSTIGTAKFSSFV